MVGAEHMEELDKLDLAHRDNRENTEAGARFRERRAALEDTGLIGGGERMAFQTKTPGSLSQAFSGTIPSPTKAAGSVGP